MHCEPYQVGIKLRVGKQVHSRVRIKGNREGGIVRVGKRGTGILQGILGGKKPHMAGEKQERE